MISFVGLCVLLGIGTVLRVRVRLFHKLYLPSCVIAGLFGLIIIQALAAIDSRAAPIAVVNKALADLSRPWAALPSFLINVVFACLFLGTEIPKLSTLWRRAGPQVMYGQVVAWGQYVVGLGLWILVLWRLYPQLPAMFAAILPVGFEGGHGTAAGMGPVFDELGWADGKDFALTSATFGILSAIMVGMILVNWAARRGHVRHHQRASDAGEGTASSSSFFPADSRPSAGKLVVGSDLVETFSVQIIVVAIAIGLGYLFKQGLLSLESLWPALAEKRILASFPLFPLCMIGGLIVQSLNDRVGKHGVIDAGLIRRIQNSSLDFLVTAAVATIQLKVILAGLAPLLVLVAAGIAWNVFCVLVLARRFFRDAWFERAVAEMGQSMGVTATGLLLLRVVDPDYETPAADAFACKQLVHEPFMGGGLWTGAAIPLIAAMGAGPVFAIAVVAIVIWFVVAILSGVLHRTST